ncbi:uncharacterized protein LY89DRAFT_773299 [Mollisia scopiformis]|uniref:Uncharacterized protein n=1 Tax=Mollisia scopiformis TaxID=149040 RepID=A0A194XG92_MOLSC|nr:uncharacterized protein LY89DRAFT_773299 [Mollisia scopiformis]KUJ19188.1 hypothetical protein LY89DRAFT_773299 [Mollisia scopiformis]
MPSIIEHAPRFDRSKQPTSLQIPDQFKCPNHDPAKYVPRSLSVLRLLALLPYPFDNVKSEVLVELWFIADFAQTPKLQTEVVNALEEARVQYERSIPTSKLVRIYKKTREGSSLRKYTVEALVARNKIEPENYHQQLTIDLVKAFSIESTSLRTAIQTLVPAKFRFRFDVDMKKCQMEQISKQPTSPPTHQQRSTKRSRASNHSSNARRRGIPE